MLQAEHPMRATIAIAALCVLGTGCDDLRGDGGHGGASLVSSSGGEVALADGGSLEFGVTSEQYKRWDRARKGIEGRLAARFGAILQPDAPTERSIEEAVAFLESQPSARRAIEAAGMSTRAFVVMTVALEQEMRRASGQPVIRQPDPAPYEFPMVDTTMIAPMPAPVPAPYPVDTFTRTPPVPVPGVDTTVVSPRIVLPPPSRDTAKPTPTIFRRDTARGAARPDSAAPRDTLSTIVRPRLRKDTAAAKPDSQPPAPPDTLPRP
jgi:hypothetical protein